MKATLSQHKSGTYTVIRTASSGGKGEITDRMAFDKWTHAVNLFCLKITQEFNGCTWQIICPDGKIGAESQF